MTSDQTIKTPEVRFDRRVSFFVWFLREAVQNMAALAGRSFHLWGVLSFINWFYGNAETKFPRIARAFTPMRDCNIGLGDKTRRVGSGGAGDSDDPNRERRIDGPGALGPAANNREFSKPRCRGIPFSLGGDDGFGCGGAERRVLRKTCAKSGHRAEAVPVNPGARHRQCDQGSP